MTEQPITLTPEQEQALQLMLSELETMCGLIVKYWK